MKLRNLTNSSKKECVLCGMLLHCCKQHCIRATFFYFLFMRRSVHTLNCEHMNIQGAVCNKLSLVEKEEKVTPCSKVAVDNSERCIMYVTMLLLKIHVF